MSGRAGRRGFDSVGRVVFFRVPTHKLKSLLTSAVPDLKGTQGGIINRYFNYIPTPF
jgi:hypothetical protein